MRSSNEIKTMKLPRFLAKWNVIPLTVGSIDLVIFLAVNYVINVVSSLIHNGLSETSFGPVNLLPLFWHWSGSTIGLYIFLIVVLAALDGILVYQIRVSLSDKELNHGQKGTARWTSQEEVRQQYKSVPLKNEFFPGRGGTIVSRQADRLYIDDSHSNTLVIGTTRSGKGEMYVFPSIDVYSRAEKLEDRPSMIISDPKLELYKGSKRTLEARGYIVRLLNLADPMHSMGYNPLQLVVDYYRAGLVEKAQMAAKTFSFSIFAADNSTQEPIWKNTATDLFTALIIAIATDCMEEDKRLNEERRQAWSRKRADFAELTEDEQQAARSKYEELSGKNEDVLLLESLYYIPTEVPFTQVHPNEKKVSCFSCLNFFRELCDRKALAKASSQMEREKIAETALDEYFNNRPPLDYAKSLYQEIKTAGDRTKGSVYLNMQSAVSIFALDNIARLTAENDVDIEEIGYGEKPVAIFIGIPSEDRSNHFLVTTFIAQVYQYLFNLAKTRKGSKQGKLDRRVKFILDEFGNFPEIENFAGFVTVCLGLGVSFDIYVQALNQISAIYKDHAKTILENFANQIYIKSVGKETAEEFSEVLGKTTLVEVQRSGSRFTLDKNYTESATERPLMYPDELARLREGECVVYRGIKRTDRLGVAIESFPIINEYADEPGEKIKQKIKADMLADRSAGRNMRHPDKDENRDTTPEEELHIRIGRWQMEHGTALLYRYMYLTDTFPNPDEIAIEEVNTESRAHIDYTAMIYEPEQALRRLSDIDEDGCSCLEDLPDYLALCYRLQQIDEAYAEHLGITGKDTLAAVTEAVCRSDYSTAQKQEILALIGGEAA